MAELAVLVIMGVYMHRPAVIMRVAMAMIVIMIMRVMLMSMVMLTPWGCL